MIGIYKITSPSGRVYIGQSRNIKKRFSHYKSYDCKGQRKLYNSFIKYDVCNHIFEIVEECDIDDLNQREHFYQLKYNCLNNGLNIVLSDPKTKKLIITDESRIKRSDSKKGKLNPMYGKKGIDNPLFGKKLSKEHKKKLSNNSGQSKQIIDTYTNIIYKSLTDACEMLGLNYGYMMNVMQGYRKNKTTLIWKT